MYNPHRDMKRSLRSSTGSQGLHQSIHWGKNALRHLITNIFDGVNFTTTVKQLHQSCIVCVQVNLEGSVHPLPLLKPAQLGSDPGKDWQPDFTQMPPCKDCKFLLVFVDTFTGWREAFPCKTERTTEVTKVLL